jgi:hypothetical protein
MSFQFVNKGASIFNPFTSLKYITSFSFFFFLFSFFFFLLWFHAHKTREMQSNSIVNAGFCMF